MSLEQEIIKIIAEELDIDPSSISATTDLQADLGTDSIDNISILSHINHKYKIPIRNEVVNNLHTVADIVKLIEDNIDNE